MWTQSADAGIQAIRTKLYKMNKNKLEDLIKQYGVDLSTYGNLKLIKDQLVDIVLNQIGYNPALMKQIFPACNIVVKGKKAIDSVVNETENIGNNEETVSKGKNGDLSLPSLTKQWQHK